VDLVSYNLVILQTQKGDESPEDSAPHWRRSIYDKK